MWTLIGKAYLTLVWFDFQISRGEFAALRRRVRECRPSKAQIPKPVESVCSAVDLACIWYPKEVLCLQRSATTAYLLKRLGVPAQMVIGTQILPLKAHAWVEVDGNVVNDKAYVSEMYSALDRC